MRKLQQYLNNERIFRFRFDSREISFTKPNIVIPTYLTGYFRLIKCLRSKRMNATVETAFYQCVVHTEF